MKKLTLLAAVMLAAVLVPAASAAIAPSTSVSSTSDGTGTPITALQIDAATGTSVVSPDSAPSGVPCWFHQFSHQWGVQPFDQILIDKVYWCANSSKTKLIYRTSQVSEQTDVVAQGSTSQTHLAGAADGSTYFVEWEACGNFTLGLPYGIGYNVQDCMAMYVTDTGGHSLYWHN